MWGEAEREVGKLFLAEAQSVNQHRTLARVSGSLCFSSVVHMHMHSSGTTTSAGIMALWYCRCLPCSGPHADLSLNQEEEERRRCQAISVVKSYPVIELRYLI